MFSITEVRIKLSCESGGSLLAFASIVLDQMWVVHDLKIIESSTGHRFVAMPDRKLTERCPGCGTKNKLTAAFCNYCGGRLPELDLPLRNGEESPKLHADVAHPINQEARAAVQTAVLQAFEKELQRAACPGYVCSYEVPFRSEQPKPSPRMREQGQPRRGVRNWTAKDWRIYKRIVRPAGRHLEHGSDYTESSFGEGILPE